MPCGAPSAYRPTVSVFLVAVAAVWGAGTGLLIPRIAYRLAVEPDEPWRTACPGGHPITGPFGGWLGRARCAAGDAGSAGADVIAPAAQVPSPHGRYGPRTTTVALVTALVCAALAAATGARPEVAVWLLGAPVGVLLAVVDHRVQRLPDILTLPLGAGTAVLLGVAALLPAHAGSWRTSLLGLVALGAGYFVLFIAHPKGFGFGDVKLAVALGAALGWYGWVMLVFGSLVGLMLAGCYGLTLVVLRRAGRKSAIPLGPFLLSGAFLGLLLGAL